FMLAELVDRASHPTHHASRAGCRVRHVETPRVLLGLELNDSLSVGEFAVAAGTLLLAVFTAVLGWFTRRSANAAQDAVERAEEPYVIAVPTRPEVGAKRGGKAPPFEIYRWREPVPHPRARHVLRFQLWNIGAGPGITHEVRLISHEHRELRELVLAEGLE